MPLTKLSSIKTILTSPRKSQTAHVETAQLEQTFETLLTEQDIPQSLRERLRTMDPFVKQSFIDVTASTPVTPPSSSRKHGRSRSRIFMLPSSKKNKHNMETAEDMIEPSSFIEHLSQDRRTVQLAVVRRLKLLLRTQRIAWTTSFIKLLGLKSISDVIARISELEWRDDEDDKLLSELLGCTQSICGMYMSEVINFMDNLLVTIVELLFSDRQPSEHRCRSQIVNIVLTYLNAAPDDGARRARALRILNILEEPRKPLAQRPLEMLEQAHTPRPYRRWMNELEKPVKDCFWIFLHSENSVEVLTLPALDALLPRKPIPASSYVGSVEWTAIDYICQHVTLINALLAALQAQERAELRTHLRTSHFERICGQHLRKASKKFYPHLHEKLVIWASRARADGWCNTRVVTGTARDDSEVTALTAVTGKSQVSFQRHARTQSHFLPELKF